MTTDAIMARAKKCLEETGWMCKPEGGPEELAAAWVALRAAVEQMVRSLSAWEQVWEGIRDNHEPNLNPTNKPLAVAATFQLAISRAERAEQEHQFQAALVKELLPYQGRAVRAEQEAAALRALLREARPYLDRTRHFFGVPGGDLTVRIDAAIKEGK